MMLVLPPHNPTLGTSCIPVNWQPFDIIELMHCSSLHQFTVVCTSLNNGINKMISIACTSLHQFFPYIHKEKRGMGGKAYYIHKPKLVQSGANN